MFLFFCLDAKEPKNQGFACFATRSLHSAGRIARSGRSLDAHQPRPILSLAFGIGYPHHIFSTLVQSNFPVQSDLQSDCIEYQDF